MFLQGPQREAQCPVISKTVEFDFGETDEINKIRFVFNAKETCYLYKINNIYRKPFYRVSTYNLQTDVKITSVEYICYNVPVKDLNEN